MEHTNKPSAARLWADWLAHLEAEHAKEAKHNVARANTVFVQGLVRGLRELKGFIAPHRGIQFADGSQSHAYPDGVIPKIKN